MKYMLMDYVNEAGWPLLTRAEKEHWLGDPCMLYRRRTMFDGVKEKLNLDLTKTRAFGIGNVHLCYQPAV